MKMSVSGQHDTSHGVWQRVCESCFSSKQGHDEPDGAIRSHSALFLRTRQRHVDRLQLEANRLENRLEKLAEIYKSTDVASSTTLRTRNREAEKLIVPWQDDRAATNCPFCFLAFGIITNRRHHCRLCGRVVCGAITCSENFDLKGKFGFCFECRFI
jgi:hypothetical protein